MKKPAKKPAKSSAKNAAKSTARKVTKKPAPKVAPKAAQKPAKKPTQAAPKKLAVAPKAAAKATAKPAAKASAKKAVRPVARPAPAAPALEPRGPRPIPEGFHAVTPYLAVEGAAAAITFYEQAFGATEVMRMTAPNGLLGHAEIRIGDSIVMLADEWPGMYAKAPSSLGGVTCQIMLYVPSVDAFMARAVRHGATVTQPPSDMFWGDRFGKLRDPFGHEWAVATHVEDVPPEEMGRRMEEAMKSMGPPSDGPAGEGDDGPPEAA